MDTPFEGISEEPITVVGSTGLNSLQLTEVLNSRWRLSECRQVTEGSARAPLRLGPRFQGPRQGRVESLRLHHFTDPNRLHLMGDHVRGQPILLKTPTNHEEWLHPHCRPAFVVDLGLNNHVYRTGLIFHKYKDITVCCCGSLAGHDNPGHRHGGVIGKTQKTISGHGFGGECIPK